MGAQGTMSTSAGGEGSDTGRPEQQVKARALSQGRQQSEKDQVSSRRAGVP